MAALLYGGWLESVYGRGVVMVSGDGIHVGLGVSLGLDALLLWELGVCVGIGLGMAAWRMEHVARRAALCGGGKLSSSGRASGHGDYSGCGEGWAGVYEYSSDEFCGEPRVGGLGNFKRIGEQPALLELASGKDGLGARGSGTAVFGEFGARRRIRPQRGEYGHEGWRRGSYGRNGIGTFVGRNWRWTQVSNY